MNTIRVQKEEPYVCPICGARNGEMIDWLIYTDELELKLQCPECETTWYDRYDMQYRTYSCSAEKNHKEGEDSNV